MPVPDPRMRGWLLASPGGKQGVKPKGAASPIAATGRGKERTGERKETLVEAP
jgi:hypothetical protein